MSISIQPTPINPSSIHAQFTSAAIRHFVSNITVAVVRVSVQFTSRSRSRLLALITMISGPPAVLPSERPTNERWLYTQRGVVVGFDGGHLDDNMIVFVVPRYRVTIYPCTTQGFLDQAIQKVDYFCGFSHGMPIALMMVSKRYIPAMALVGPYGFVGHCVVNIQRRWRRWRWKCAANRYDVQMVKFGLFLARAWSSRKYSFR